MARSVLTEENINLFFDRINQIKRKFGWNNAKFARAAGVSPVTILRWSRREHPPTSTSVEKLAGSLGLRKEWLLGQCEDMYPDKEDSHDLRDKDVNMDELTEFYEEVCLRLDEFIMTKHKNVSSKHRNRIIMHLVVKYINGQDINPRSLHSIFDVMIF